MKQSPQIIALDSFRPESNPVLVKSSAYSRVRIARLVVQPHPLASAVTVLPPSSLSDRKLVRRLDGNRDFDRQDVGIPESVTTNYLRSLYYIRARGALRKLAK
jgi:hypothetical protein